MNEVVLQSELWTLIAGHSRSVQGVADMLTTEDQIGQLQALGGGRFPREFQAVIEVRMQSSFGELSIEAVKPVLLLELQ